MRVAVLGSERSVGAGEKIRKSKDGRARSSMHQYVGVQECMQRGKCENQAHAQHDSTSGNAMDKSEGKIQYRKQQARMHAKDNREAGNAGQRACVRRHYAVGRWLVEVLENGNSWHLYTNT